VLQPTTTITSSSINTNLNGTHGMAWDLMMMMIASSNSKQQQQQARGVRRKEKLFFN